MTARAAIADSLIDGDALRRDIATTGGSTEADRRAAILAGLRTAIADGRARAATLLMEDGDGLACTRRLSYLMDTVIAVVDDVARRTLSPAETPPRMSVVAVGGYGRGTLAPGSDIDLLFLVPTRQTATGERVVEYVLYLLWDLGFKVGHSTRSLDECIKLARADMTIRTALLEARRVSGDWALFDQLVVRFSAEVVAGSAPEFVAAKLAERDERHRRTGQSRYLVEPNVKDGKGGLRDLHTLFWIAKYVFRATAGDDLVKAGVFSRAEYNRFRKAEGFLWAVRCHLHFLTGRPEEKLSFEHQRAMAERLGYTNHPGQENVERFMKHYFLVAKEVGDLTQIFCAALEERHVKQPPKLNRFFALARRRGKTLPQVTDFVLENDRITVADPEVFARDPVNILRIFHLADRYDLAFHPDATQLLTRSLRLIDAALRESKEANRLFLEVLTSPRQPETVLRRMNESGVLGRFIPEFGKVVAMMQFGLYHHYTVDEHLLRAVGWLSRIERGDLGEEHPLANEIIGTVLDRTVLYVAVFLHDIAKGRPEDHSIAGARIAEKLCPRLGLSASQTETVAWLIRQHLHMSTVAQSRDLNDRKTILDFAEIVQSPERLKLLLILTVADIRAVGPGVWNGWKGQLLRTLYWETEPILTGGHSQVPRNIRVEAARRELIEALKDWPELERWRYAERHYPAYLLRVDLPVKLDHARLIRAAEAEKRPLATDVRLHAFEEITEITVFAPDHPRLLSVIAGACTAAGANIVDAQVYTTTDGMALDSIFVSREFPIDEDETRRAAKIGRLIEDALAGRTRLPDAIAARARPRPQLKPFTVATRIAIDNSWSNKFTAIEASGLDRPGLLYGLTRALSDLNLNIGSAHIATFGERAVDVFYVTDLIGHKITNAAREASIRKRLEAVFDPPDEPAPAAKPHARKPTA